MLTYEYGNPVSSVVLLQMVDDHDLDVIENEIVEHIENEIVKLSEVSEAENDR